MRLFWQKKKKQQDHQDFLTAYSPILLKYWQFSVADLLLLEKGKKVKSSEKKGFI